MRALAILLAAIALAQGSVVAGRVIDARTGEPLAGVVVSIPAVGLETRTGEDGRYSFPGSAPCSGLLKAYMPGFYPGHRHYSLGRAGDELAAVLLLYDWSTPTVEGRVVPGSTNESVAGIRVMTGPRGYRFTVTDETGYYILPLPEPGRHTVRASTSKRWASRVLYVDDGGHLVYDLVLEPHERIVSDEYKRLPLPRFHGLVGRTNDRPWRTRIEQHGFIEGLDFQPGVLVR